MTLVRFNPMRELLEVEKEFNKLFSNYENKFGLRDSKDYSDEYQDAVWSPLSDIYEDNDKFQIKLDLPGVEKDEVKISYSNGQLTISGERKQESASENYKYHRVERLFGKFYRAYNLPKDILHDKISADFRNGQLNIAIPKSELAKPKSIEINVN